MRAVRPIELALDRDAVGLQMGFPLRNFIPRRAKTHMTRPIAPWDGIGRPPFGLSFNFSTVEKNKHAGPATEEYRTLRRHAG